MFRKMAIALVAASVFTAPVLAQNETLSGGGSTKSVQGTSTPAGENAEKAEKAEKPEKAEKSAESMKKAEKRVTRRHRAAARHARHGTKAAKYGKSHTTAVYGKHRGTRTTKYESRRVGHGRAMAEMTKSEKRHMRYGRTIPKHAYGRASKHMRSKTMTKPGLD